MLFRIEATEAQRKGWLGEVRIARMTGYWVVVSLALGLAAGVLAFLWLGHYTRRERVTGQLVPTEGVLNLSAAGSGLVTRIFVEEGQSVRRGDPIIEISGEYASAEHGNALAAQSQRIVEQRNQLANDLLVQRKLLTEQQRVLRIRRDLTRAQLIQAEQEHGIQAAQVDRSQALLDKIRLLLKQGYVSAIQIQQQEEAISAAKAQSKALQGKVLGTRQQLSALDEELARAPLDAALRASVIERELAAAESSLAQNEAQRAQLLRSPADGVVSMLIPKVGQSLRPGQALAAVLPRGARLEAQLLVPTRAMGLMEEGNRVVLRYQAFPYQKYGQHYGHVMHISRNALAPDEVLTLAGERVVDPRYRVTVGIERQCVAGTERCEPLRPGMSLDADIMLESRSLMEWMFEPLYGLRRRYAAEEGIRHDR